MAWQLQDAKNKLGEIVDASISKGPQIISRHGRNVAVVISYADYQSYIAPKKGLKRALMSSGLEELTLTRSKSDPGRATDLT